MRRREGRPGAARVVRRISSSWTRRTVRDDDSDLVGLGEVDILVRVAEDVEEALDLRHVTRGSRMLLDGRPSAILRDQLNVAGIAGPQSGPDVLSAAGGCPN